MASNEYDFIIIGGGTAGLVVAARLSENPEVRVLILEAGADQTKDPRVTTPGLYHALQNTEADWQYKTVAQVGVFYSAPTE